MGKYGGKVLTVYITPSGVRVCEGENRGGNPEITKFFTVKGVADYFSPGSPSTPPEIINISGLVSAIVDQCKNMHTTARRVMVVSDCFGIETTVDKSLGFSGFKNILTGDVKAIGGLFKSKGEPPPPDKAVCKVPWGDITIDGRVNQITTVTMGDKYLLKSLVDEFYTYGYTVIFCSGSQEVLMNLWQTEQASFDSQGKVILDLGVDIRMSVFFKDVPVQTTTVPMVDRESLYERITSLCKQALASTGRSPHVYLAGATFADTVFYGEVIDLLEQEKFIVYDLFARPALPENYDEMVMMGTIDPIITPDYYANVAMLMTAYSKKLISLTPAVDLSETMRRNSKSLAILFCAVMGIAFLGTGALSVIRLYELYQVENSPSILSSLESQESSLRARQESLNSTIATLTEADTTVLELMKFIDTNQSPTVHVVTVDTSDMLPDSITVETPTTGAEGEEDIFAGTAGTGYVRQNIIIRGYAKTGNDAVAYFDRLYNYGLPITPVLNGVERYLLPDGEQVYVFEIELGGDFE